MGWLSGMAQSAEWNDSAKVKNNVISWQDEELLTWVKMNKSTW
jgi:hypothetical protein